MRFLIVTGTPGVVINAVESATKLSPGWVRSDTGQIGDSWDGQTFTTSAADPGRISVESEEAIQEMLDNLARVHGYDSMERLISYAASSNTKWAAEGVYGRQYRDDCWTKANQIQTDVQAGTRTLPSVAEVLAEMPPVAWPT